MRKLAPPNDTCARKKEWLTSLSPQALQLECMRYMEMARLGMLASTTYCNALDTKCKDIREQFTAELAKSNANATKLEEEKVKLAEENALMKTNVENLQRAMSMKDDEMVDMKKQRDASNLKAEKWRVRAENVVSDYLKSEDCEAMLADEVGPHWEQGIKIGVRQAMARFGDIDPKIVYFTPDYTDLFGEPPIGSTIEGDTQGMDMDVDVAKTSAALPEDRDDP